MAGCVSPDEIICKQEGNYDVMWIVFTVYSKNWTPIAPKFNHVVKMTHEMCSHAIFGAQNVFISGKNAVESRTLSYQLLRPLRWLKLCSILPKWSHLFQAPPCCTMTFALYKRTALIFTFTNPTWHSKIQMTCLLYSVTITVFVSTLLVECFYCIFTNSLISKKQGAMFDSHGDPFDETGWHPQTTCRFRKNGLPPGSPCM